MQPMPYEVQGKKASNRGSHHDTRRAYGKPPRLMVLSVSCWQRPHAPKVAGLEPW
jgi:hypothetical protein